MLLGFVPIRPVSGAAAGAPRKTLGTIERKDPRLDAIVPKDAVLEVLAEGFAWTEGPVWDKKMSRVLFSDIPANAINEWTAAGGIKLFLKPSGYSGSTPFTGREPGSNGLTFDATPARPLPARRPPRRAARGRTGRQPLRRPLPGQAVQQPQRRRVPAQRRPLLHRPALRPPRKARRPRASELAFQRRLPLAKDGKVTLLTKELTRPNGIAFSPDEKTLYVANSDPERAIWMAYDVQDDGTVGQRTCLLRRDRVGGPRDRKGLPDGLKVDRAGNLFATGPGGVHVLTPKAELWAPSTPACRPPTAPWATTAVRSTSPPTRTSAASV